MNREIIEKSLSEVEAELSKLDPKTLALIDARDSLASLLAAEGEATEEEQEAPSEVKPMKTQKTPGPKTNGANGTTKRRRTRSSKARDPAFMARVKELVAAGKTQRAVASELQISLSTVSRILNDGKDWTK
jgi:DNA invertase Pin-like site-specific DNA recombinase